MALPAEHQARVSVLQTKIDGLKAEREQRAKSGVSRASAGMSSFETMRIEQIIQDYTKEINFIYWAHDDGEDE